MTSVATSDGTAFTIRRNVSLVLFVFGLIAVATNIHAQEEQCGLWMGPSPIKEAEDHGWGHSIFTGKFIKKGTIVLGSGILDEVKEGKVSGDMMVPVYDWESIDMASYVLWDDNFWLDDDNTEKRAKEKERIHSGFQEALDKSSMMEPALFHMLWNGNTYMEEILESEEGMRAFIPGLAAICPCTWRGFNLRQVHEVTYRDWRNDKGRSHDDSPPPPHAGSFGYLSNAMFRAERDIQPGEELVVECSDNGDNFDAEKYGPTKFKPKEAGGYSICLDDKVEVRLADHTPNIASGSNDKSYGGQRGLFAKRKLKKDEILTSTPMIPVHMEEMTMDRKKYAEILEDAEAQGNIEKIGIPPLKKQLLLNYMFGHPESSLMWLAIAPLLLAANHAPHDQTVQPNAKLQWHETDVYPDKVDGKPLSRRQRFHHAELLQLDSKEVALKHGMGLMVDLVATREISDNEEILIDYGKAWDDAWKEHTKIWDTTIKAINAGHVEEKLKQKQERKREREEQDRERKLSSHRIKHQIHQRHVENSMTALPLSSYVTASDYNELYNLEELRTVSELRRNPYPSNIETACYFDYDWLDSDITEDESVEEVTVNTWYEMEEPFGACLLPCIVTERREYVPLEEHQEEFHHDDDDFVEVEKPEITENGGSNTSKRYTVKLLDHYQENTAIEFDCHIFLRFQYYITDVPREGIKFVNKLHSTDQWIDQAFRQPIGLPDEMVPMEWKDLNRRKGTRGGTRKKNVVKPVMKQMTEDEEEDEKDYSISVKKWNEVESRRDHLIEVQEKWMEKKYSALGDL